MLDAVCAAGRLPMRFLVAIISQPRSFNHDVGMSCYLFHPKRDASSSFICAESLTA